MATPEEHLKIKTERVQVRVFTKDFEIEGNAHAKPGGYYGRVTDILNQSRFSFIPITEARYRSRTGPLTEFFETSCLVVQIENIEVIDLLEEG